MAAHDGLFSRLTPKRHLLTNERYIYFYIELDEDEDLSFWWSHPSYLIIGLRSHSN